MNRRRLLRKKRRLTKRLRRRDLRVPRHRIGGLPERKLLRTRLFAIDAKLEQAGLIAPPPVGSQWENGWLKGATRMPGANAGYRAGRCLMEGAVVHYTVGTDSRGPGLRGLFAFLIPKAQPAIQFAEADAVCWHACEWNFRCFGVETEKLKPPDQEPSTDNQIDWWGYIAGAAREYGIQPTGYDSSTQRLPIGAPLREPYTAHRSLVHRSCDQHTDYLPDAEMARVLAIAGGPSSSSDEEDDVYTIYVIAIGPIQGWLLGDGTGYSWLTGESLTFWRNVKAFGVKVNEFTIDKDKEWARSLVAQAPPPPQ